MIVNEHECQSWVLNDFFSVPFPGGMIAQYKSFKKKLKKKTLWCTHLNLFQPNVAIHFVQCSNAVSSKAAPEHHAATTMFESIVFLGSKDSLVFQQFPVHGLNFGGS